MQSVNRGEYLASIFQHLVAFVQVQALTFLVAFAQRAQHPSMKEYVQNHNVKAICHMHIRSIPSTII